MTSTNADTSRFSEEIFTAFEDLCGNEQTFSFDSGATNHFCAVRSWFSSIQPLAQPRKIWRMNPVFQ